MSTNNDPPELVQLVDINVESYLAESVAVDTADLNNEYVKLPAELAYWSERYARAYRSHLRAKILAEEANAKLRIALREEMLAKRDKVTESMIDAAVSIHPDWQKARHHEVNAESEKVRLRGVLDALLAKKDMLVQLGATIRQEQKSQDPTIYTQHGGRVERR